MLTNLTLIEQLWLRDGMTEDLIEQMRNDPSQMRFALAHLEGISSEGSQDVASLRAEESRRSTCL